MAKIKYHNGTDWVVAGTDASAVDIVDSGELYTATNVEDALAEVKNQVATHEAKNATTEQKGHVQLGITAGMAAEGNHNHSGVYEPADANIMKKNVAQAMTANLVANGGTDYGTAKARNIYAGTADLTAGISALTSGNIYIVYE
jgi:hypothetical protein